MLTGGRRPWRFCIVFLTQEGSYALVVIDSDGLGETL